MIFLRFIAAVCLKPIISSNVGSILIAKIFGRQLVMSSLSPFLYKQDKTACRMLLAIFPSWEFQCIAYVGLF